MFSKLLNGLNLLEKSKVVYYGCLLSMRSYGKCRRILKLASIISDVIYGFLYHYSGGDILRTLVRIESKQPY